MHWHADMLPACWKIMPKYKVLDTFLPIPSCPSGMENIILTFCTKLRHGEIKKRSFSYSTTYWAGVRSPSSQNYKTCFDMIGAVLPMHCFPPQAKKTHVYGHSNTPWKWPKPLQNGKRKMQNMSNVLVRISLMASGTALNQKRLK